MATYAPDAIASASLATLTPCNAHQLGPYYAGEALKAGNPCYVKADGTAWRSNGTAVNAAAKVNGWCVKDTEVGRPVTLYHNVLIAWGPLTPAYGTPLFVSATAGSLDDAATTGGTASVAVVVPPPTNTTSTQSFLYVRLSAY